MARSEVLAVPTSDSAHFEVPGQFSVDAPVGTTAYLDEQGTTFALKLPTTPVTEMLISRHSAAGSDPLANALRSAISTFFARCAPGVGLRSESIEPAVDAPPDRAVLQGVACDPDGTWWFVRTVVLGQERDYYWLQWCGREKDLHTVVLRTAMSFVPVSDGGHEPSLRS